MKDLLPDVDMMRLKSQHRIIRKYLWLETHYSKAMVLTGAKKKILSDNSTQLLGDKESELE